MTTRKKPRAPRTRKQSARLSMAAENYLLSIYRLQEQGVRVTLSVLAAHLETLPSDEGIGTSLPSVGGMIRRLTRDGLVETNSNKEVALTTKGRKPAESIVRRHRLAELLVVEKLGVDLHLAHIEAHRLEHAISEYLEERIIDTLGNPKTCPFGHPIPGSGYIPNRKVKALDDAREGEMLVIESVPEDDQALLTYFVERSLVPGRNVDVKETAKARGVITLGCDDGDLVFSYDVAAKIRVRPR